MNIEEILRQKYGLEMPKPAAPVGMYKPVVQTGNLLFISGQLPTVDGRLAYTGKIGKDLTVEEGQKAALYCALNCLAQLQAYIGDLGRVRQIVQLVGYVRSAEGFDGQPQVINGASRLLLDLFGERGAHTRLALGTNELPAGAATEVTLVVEVE